MGGDLAKILIFTWEEKEDVGRSSDSKLFQQISFARTNTFEVLHRLS